MKDDKSKNESKNNKEKKGHNWNVWMKLITLISIVSIVLLLMDKIFHTHSETEKTKYAEFVELLADGKIETVTIDPKKPTFQFTIVEDEEKTGDKKDEATTSGKEKPKVVHITDNPKVDGFKNEVLLQSPETKFTELSPDPNASPMRTILLFVQLAFFALFGIYLFRMLKTMKPMETEAKENSQQCSIKFQDIAGNEEAKDDMKFLVDFLKNPKVYEDAGAALPSGAIFYGPPGTGKTLMAKAIAGEAGVPFFSMSGSDFTEMFVGIGAKRVRDLFASARKKSPSIIFIDEIDSLGGSRDHTQNSEQRQTLNAILKELDGFTANTGIIVIGATNRLEDLDPAFIRPGRFDKHIAINLPEQKDRLAILRLHAKGKKLASDISLEELSKITIGISGAGLEAILNEAAILSVRNKHAEIHAADIEEAYFSHVMKGHQKKGTERDEKEIELVAWHEAGHAMAAKLLTNHDVPKVTIISSTSGAGGVTFMTPSKMGLYTREELIADIKVLYAGRVAEELLAGSASLVTTGASQDIKMASEKIRNLLVHYGMSHAFGMINPEIVARGEESSRRTLEEAATLSNQLYGETLLLLRKNKDVLESIATQLIQKETLTSLELDVLIKGSELHSDTEPVLIG